MRYNRRGVSPAVSTVIMTAVSVVLVLVAGNFALQVLESQRAVAEFSTVQQSMLAFDDAVRDVAWDLSGTRSIRFTNSYGNMRLINDSKTFQINATGLDVAPNVNLLTFKTACVKYQMPTGYGMPGIESSYLLGDESCVISKLTDSIGQVQAKHESGFNSITLNYRVRIAEEGPIMIEGVPVKYVDIFVIRMNCSSSTIGAGDFNLVCRNEALNTIQSSVYKAAGTPRVWVSDGIAPEPDYVDLTFVGSGELVVFNLIVADVRVSY